ncbi:hypothetical protein MKX01_039867, partial [Papaver californicum]
SPCVLKHRQIVKNIGEGPLLVHIYSSKNKGGTSPVGSPLTTIPIPIVEKSEPESWVGVTRNWEEGSPVPDGIILVELLNVDDDNYNGIKDETPNMTNGSSNTETWGLVIQGRGVDSASSCYILKTCRDVGSLLGFCTHF